MDSKDRESLLREWERIQREMRDNPRTALQCAARGCDGCEVCLPVIAREGKGE